MRDASEVVGDLGKLQPSGITRLLFAADVEETDTQLAGPLSVLVSLGSLILPARASASLEEMPAPGRLILSTAVCTLEPDF